MERHSGNSDSSPHTADDVTTATTESQQPQQQIQQPKQELSKKWSVDPDSVFKVSKYIHQMRGNNPFCSRLDNLPIFEYTYLID